jgi:(2Fe-2S) ferredoxin
MTRFRLSVCQGLNCRGGGADRLFEIAKAELERLGLTGRVELNRGGCYSQCEHGPNLLLRERRQPLAFDEDAAFAAPPKEHWCHHATAEAVLRLIEQVVQGQPLCPKDSEA